MARTTEVRNVASGWTVTEYIGCDLDDEGRAVPATADSMRSTWAPTEAAVRQKI